MTLTANGDYFEVDSVNHAHKIIAILLQEDSRMRFAIDGRRILFATGRAKTINEIPPVNRIAALAKEVKRTGGLNIEVSL
jgi:hypothetical protein